MGNHHILNHQGCDISNNDSWQALATDQLPDGIALRHISLLEILHKQEKLDVIVPLTDLLDGEGELAGGLLQKLRALLDDHTSRTGVWLTSDTDADMLANLSEFLLGQALIVLYVPAFADGRVFSIARALRKLGYSGEIRMAGQFGRDQIAYLLRVGANSFVVDEHDVHSGFAITQAFSALASSHNGQDASALPLFA